MHEKRFILYPQNRLYLVCCAADRECVGDAVRAELLAAAAVPRAGAARPGDADPRGAGVRGQDPRHAALAAAPPPHQVSCRHGAVLDKAAINSSCSHIKAFLDIQL